LNLPKENIQLQAQGKANTLNKSILEQKIKTETIEKLVTDLRYSQ
jgi:hypothetical protein